MIELGRDHSPLVQDMSIFGLANEALTSLLIISSRVQLVHPLCAHFQRQAQLFNHPPWELVCPCVIHVKAACREQEPNSVGALNSQIMAVLIVKCTTSLRKLIKYDKLQQFQSFFSHTRVLMNEQD